MEAIHMSTMDTMLLFFGTFSLIIATTGGSCPSNEEADIVFVIDSSTSLRAVTRAIMKQFLLELIGRWTASANSINVAIVPYNNRVLRGKVVKLTSLSDNDEQVIAAINGLSMKRRGSLTGKALTFTLSEVLSSSNGNRPSVPDIVIVLSDGRGQDKVNPPLRKMWNAGITTFAVGFQSRRNLPIAKRQLIKISRNVNSRMHLTKWNSIGNIETMMDSLEQIYCPFTGNLCDETLLLTPENGRVSCTNENVFGSVCTFTCDRFHSRIGSQRSECVETQTELIWSDPSPTCEPDLCQPPREVLKNGAVICTRENFVNSVCTFKCTTPGYQLYPPNHTRNRCLPTKIWDRDPPCCARPCPPNAKIDAFFILHSSLSIGHDNWAILTDFIRGFLNSFTISDEMTKFALVRYNDLVDTATQIQLNDYPNDREGLLRAFDAFPYDGNGTNTGQAISHVLNNMMSQVNGNRPDAQDLVMVVTGGNSEDDVLTPSNMLRDKGAITFVAAIPRSQEGLLDEEKLREIAGSGQNILFLNDFENVIDVNSERIVEVVCAGDPCEK